jgi:hypothetical protein
MPVSKTSGMPKMPKSLGQCADALYNIRQLRLAKQKEVDELAQREAAYRQHLIDNLPKSDANGITGSVARATIVKEVQPRVADWDKLYAYIKKNNAFELLQRRVSAAAVEERWDADKQVPGVETFTLVKVSLNKV